MAKDPKGHGSNARGGTGTQGMRLLKTHTNGPHTAKVYKNPEWNENVVKFFSHGEYQSKADHHTDDLADAHATAQYGIDRANRLDARAAESLASGPKSAAAPVHSAMDRPGYHAGAVQNAIDSSTRHGRKIGGREAKAIHALLRGRS